MLVFALPCVLPMPPGIPTICGIALLIIGLNLIAMRRRLWLPSAIADKSVARADLQRVADRVVPHMQRLERFCKPRFPIVTEALGKVLIGLVVAMLGFIMILPIPFLGNMPPGFAASVIAIGMTERDGLIVLIGLIVSIAAIAVAWPPLGRPFSRSSTLYRALSAQARPVALVCRARAVPDLAPLASQSATGSPPLATLGGFQVGRFRIIARRCSADIEVAAGGVLAWREREDDVAAFVVRLGLEGTDGSDRLMWTTPYAVVGWREDRCYCYGVTGR
jgi:hypothetical protein